LKEEQPQVGEEAAASGWRRRSSLRLEKEEQPQVGGGAAASGWRRSSSLRLKKEQPQVGVGAA